jgi:transcriptional regulator with XRE-family HTH domain
MLVSFFTDNQESTVLASVVKGYRRNCEIGGCLSDWLAGPELGDKITAVRGKLTQAEFGERIGYSANQVGAWERGQQNPRPRALRIIAQAFGVPVEIFQAGDGEPEGSFDVADAFQMGFTAGVRRAARRVRSVVEPVLTELEAELEDGGHEPEPARYDRLSSTDEDRKTANGG